MKEQEKLEEFINSQPKLGTKEFNDLASAYFGGNPKQECEHIKEYGCIKDICSCNTNPKKAPFKHKIQSIPKEEILENRSNAYEFIDFDKQETLEEASDRAYSCGLFSTKTAFIAGAKWQQERSYSEDEILNLMYYIRTNAIENKYSWKINGENLTDAENLTDKELLKKFKKKQDMKNLHKIKENIYITSDEEIKKGDWVFAYGVVIKISMFDGLPNDNWKKIILTTDQNLISDGIEGLKKK